MSCFPCFRNGISCNRRDGIPLPAQQVLEPTIPDTNIEKEKPAEDTDNIGNMDGADHIDTGDIKAKQFTFRELAKATNNFRQQFLIGEGGFGRVYKGTLKNTGEVVAVKQLDKNGIKDQKEFIVEVLMLSLLRHKNLAHLVGYCTDGDQRLLVYEFVPGGSLDQQIHDVEPGNEALDWYTRIEIAYGVAQGLEYLHDKANPPVVYRDLKSSNILLDNDLNPKLSDFGLANLGTKGLDHMQSSSRIIGTFGYSAPEYTNTGQITLKSDVFSYGVVLLEIITGRRAIDTTKPNNEQNLVSWAHPYFKDPKRFSELADPLLEGKFPERSLNQVVAIAAMCLQEEAAARPFMSDIVTTLSFLSVKDTESNKELSPTADPTSPESSDDDKEKHRGPVQAGRIHCSGSSYSSEATSMRSRRNTSLNRKSSAGEGSSDSKYHSSKFHDISDSDDGLDDQESPDQQQDMT